MNVIKLPVIPNSPIGYEDATLEGDFQLRKFGSFEFVQNHLFDPSVIEYDENYQNDQSNSPLFKKHMEEVYSKLKSHFAKGSKLVEVGCGKGAFLNIVKQDNYFEYAGYDAAYEGHDPNIHSRYLIESDRIDADIVVLRHTLEHIRAPYSFMTFLKSIFNKDVQIFIEVPQFDWIDQHKVLFDFTYEHVNYFSAKALCSLFAEVTENGNFFGGQYQYCLASLDKLDGAEWKLFDLEEKWHAFTLDEYLDEFCSNLTFLEGKKRIWVWGGATKGVLFLKHLADNLPTVFEKIRGVVDINPKKQGFYTPSTKILINSPNVFYKTCEEGDIVLVMNPNYLNEVRSDIENNVNSKIEVISV